MSVSTEQRTSSDTDTRSDDPIFSHIIDRGDDKRHVLDILLEARIEGIELTGLCGHKFVPERDPKKYDLCPKCKELYEFAADFRGMGDAPRPY